MGFRPGAPESRRSGPPKEARLDICSERSSRLSRGYSLGTGWERLRIGQKGRILPKTVRIHPTRVIAEGRAAGAAENVSRRRVATLVATPTPKGRPKAPHLAL